MSVVTVDWSDLSNPSIDLKKQIKEAFGADGLGVIAIKGVPDWEELLTNTLPLAHKLISLPAEALAKLEHAESLYNAGWSFGKEKLGDKPDTKKGSFYFNPLSDEPRPELRELYPWAMPKNLWPKQEVAKCLHTCSACVSVCCVLCGLWIWLCEGGGGVWTSAWAHWPECVCLQRRLHPLPCPCSQPLDLPVCQGPVKEAGVLLTCCALCVTVGV